MLIFYFFALIQIFFAYKSIRGGINYLNYFRKELGKDESGFVPFVSVIIPCRGVDKDLEKNLTALFDQDYPEYEIVFVIDSEEDEALPLIRKVSLRNKINSQIIVAGRARESGQKVHNLRQAVLSVSDRARVFVFVDSDARPAKTWLKSLVAPLENKSIGGATGYRWFVQKKGGLATHLRSVWNASIASTLGENMKGNFCWGGSMAIRRDIFDRLNMRDKWKGTLSDDFALTNALRKAKLPVYFVPSALTATVEDCNFREMLEFTTRQMRITRVYSPDHFKISMIGSILFSFVFWTGIILLFFVSGINFWIVLAFILLIFSMGTGKAWLRLKAVGLVLGKYKKKLNHQFLPQLLLWTVTPIIFLCNNFLALFSNRITWRGIQYKLESANKTTIEKNNG
jgi:cellulose synthase/poly-beta-1,6-N-acetylglucosamine synthase-like glycosyltransferase